MHNPITPCTRIQAFIKKHTNLSVGRGTTQLKLPLLSQRVAKYLGMTSKNGAVRQMAHKNTTRFAPTNEQRWDPKLMLFFGIPVSQSTFTNKVCDCTFMARINYKTVRHGQFRWVKWTEDLSYSRSLRSAVWRPLIALFTFKLNRGATPPKTNARDTS